MLQLETIKLPNDLLLIDEHPVVVQETTAGIKTMSEEEIKHEKLTKRIRTGTVIKEGVQSQESFDRFGNITPTLNTFVGQTVMYMAMSVDPIDIAIEGVAIPVTTRSNYLLSIIDESVASPY